MESDLLEEIAIAGIRMAIVLAHALHFAGVLAAGALLAVTVLWTVEEVFEIHKTTRVVRAARKHRG
jgi:hypothetical protein